jgi:hypothetical protein
MNNKKHKDHVDYAKRLVELYRWYPQSKAIESTGLTVDARGDESLYKPSQLGKAWCDIKKVTAGQNKPFKLYFQAGENQLDPGSKVLFWMAGQGSIGDTPQMINSALPAYVQANCPDSLEIRTICSKVRVFDLEAGTESNQKAKPGDWIVGPVCIGFEILKGKLIQDMKVEINVGKKNGFSWKKLSGKKEFKVIIDPSDGQPKMRLPEPVVIEIMPLNPDHLEIFLPMGSNNNSEVTASISLRDKWDNRVYNDEPLQIHTPDGQIDSFLINGKSRAKIAAQKKQCMEIKAKCRSIDKYFQSNPMIKSEDIAPFIGDLHCHDFNSTAEGYPADIYQWARDEKRLDFISVPIQVHRGIDNEKWTIAKHMNEYFLDENRFVTLLAFEWQHSHYGDKVIHYLGGDMPYLPVYDSRYDNTQSLYETLRKTDAFIISHHVGYELDLHVPGADWKAVQTDIDRLAEIWSMHGSSEGFDPKDRPLIPPRREGGVGDALKAGIRMGVTGGSDTHTARPGGSVQDARPYYGGLCGVWANNLTRRDIFNALRSRQTWALTGDRIVLDFRVNGSLMGSEISLVQNRNLSVSVWAPNEIENVMLLKNQRVIHIEQDLNKIWKGQFQDTDNKPSFYQCRVKLKNGHLGVSSPVWVG